MDMYMYRQPTGRGTTQAREKYKQTKCACAICEYDPDIILFGVLSVFSSAKASTPSVKAGHHGFIQRWDLMHIHIHTHATHIHLSMPRTRTIYTTQRETHMTHRSTPVDTCTCTCRTCRCRLRYRQRVYDHLLATLPQRRRGTPREGGRSARPD